MIDKDVSDSQPEIDNKLLVGIDFGTSWIAVMSNRKHRSITRSVVGYPRDIIGRKVAGSGFVVGEDALRQEGSLELYCPLEQGVIKDSSDQDIAAARDLLVYAVSLARPRPGDEVWGVIGVPAQASILNKGILLEIANDALHVAVVVSEPFLVAYNLQRIRNAIIVDIGGGTVDVCGVKGTLPEENDQKTLMTAGDYIDSYLMTSISERYPEVQLTRNLCRRIKETHSFVGKRSNEAIVQLRTKGKPVTRDVTDQIREACEAIVPDIVEAIQTVLVGFDPECEEEALQNIYLAGGGSMIIGLDETIAAAMKSYGDVRVTRVEDPLFAGAAGALKLAGDVPLGSWDRIGDMKFFDSFIKRRKKL